ncbi:MAG: sensor histidine kinase [Streptosporangiaceae bacterium]
MGLPADWRSSYAAKARRVSANPDAAVATAGALAALAVAQAIWAALTVGGSLADAGGLLASVILVLPSLVATLPLGFARAQPTVVAVTICAANLLSLAAFHLLTAAGLAAQLIVMYKLGRRGPQILAACLALPFLALGLVIAADRAAVPRPAPPGAGPLVLAVLAASLGPVAACIGAGREFLSVARQHTATREAIAGTLLEHSARGERARISRELHDVVAHHISMIAVQAETARLATPGMPAEGAHRLSAIGDTARAALTEMRRLLGVLREDTEEPSAELRPQPGLAQLNELLDETRETSGICARLIVRGWLTALDPGVELAAFRIVQEALTNARRHAPGAAVDVELHFADDALHLRIRDNGPGPPPAGAQPAITGHGLLGMRERAAAVGGELHDGPAHGGGFLVEATLPAKSEEYAP